MLVHIPAYALKEELNYYELKTYLVQVGTAINSYFTSGNDAPLLVTTNSGQILHHIENLRSNSGYDFEILEVSQEDLDEVFPALPNGYDFNDNYKKFFQSKFYPMMKRMAEHIVHVDYDIVFMRKLDSKELCQKDITVIKYNCGGAVAGDTGWINSGFFSIQNGGFDLIEQEFVHFYVNNPSDASDDRRYREIPEEALFNKMYHERREQVALLDNYNYNFPAFNLQNDPNWAKSAICIHYHHVKAAPCLLTNDGAQFFHDHDGMRFLERINHEFYKSLLIYYQHLFEVNRYMKDAIIEQVVYITEERLGDLMEQNFNVRHYSELCN